MFDFFPKIIHCERCLLFGHTNQFGSNKPKCSKCGQSHLSSESVLIDSVVVLQPICAHHLSCYHSEYIGQSHSNLALRWFVPTQRACIQFNTRRPLPQDGDEDETLNGIFINCCSVLSIMKCVIKMKNLRISNWKETTLQRCAKRELKKKWISEKIPPRSGECKVIICEDPIVFISFLCAVLFRWKRIQSESCVKLNLDLEQWDAIGK